jgi:hypothetical protein
MSHFSGSVHVPTQPVPHHYSNATRHLCAGAYVDEEFRRRSLAGVYYQARRAVAPSYGFDLSPVLWHCLRARNIAVTRDALIVGVFVIALCAASYAALLAVAFLIMLWLATSAWALVRDVVGQLRAGSLEISTIMRGLLLMSGIFVGSLVLLVVLSVAGMFAGLAAADAAITGDATMFLLSQGMGLLLMVVLLALSVAGNVASQAQLDGLAPGRPPAAVPTNRRFAEIDAQQTGNTVVYGDFSPFVGSGPRLSTWNFAQRLLRPPNGLIDDAAEAEREFHAPPFSAPELVRYIGGRLGELSVNPEPERQLPGLTVVDRIFQAGTEVANLTTVTAVPLVDHIIGQPTSPTRHYLMCQVVSWRGELVTTVYVHVALQARTLYLEVTSAALGPCDERYRVVDKVGGTGPIAYLKAVWRGIIDSPRTIALAPVNLVRAALDAITSAADAVAPAQRVAQGYDYGAVVSVRELGSSHVLRTHVQEQDIIKHVRLIERRVLAATLDFLQTKGVDTTEYRQRVTNVLTAGVVNMGNGSVTVHGDTNARTDMGPTGSS